MTKSRFTVVAALATFALALPFANASAQAVAGNTNRTCSLASFIGFSATKCIGFYSGNLLAGGPKIAEQNTALNTLLGTSSVNYYASQVENIASVTNNTPVNFDALLFGTTVIGLHFGGGADVFGGLPEYNGSGGGTAFYVFDAGSAGLNTFSTVAGLSKASSGATLYVTGQRPACIPNVDCPDPVIIVPEPASFALVFGGLFGLGVAARRRRNA